MIQANIKEKKVDINQAILNLRENDYYKVTTHSD